MEASMTLDSDNTTSPLSAHLSTEAKGHEPQRGMNQEMSGVLGTEKFCPPCNCILPCIQFLIH